VAVAKSQGKFDQGVVNMRAERITCFPGFPSRIHSDPDSGAETFVVKLELDRGLRFATALQRLQAYKADCDAAAGKAAAQGIPNPRPFKAENGFYVSTTFSNYAQTGRPLVIMTTEVWRAGNSGGRLFRITRPNLGTSGAPQWLDNIKDNYRKATEAEVRPLWDFWYDFYTTRCTHGDRCAQRKNGFECTVGMRKTVENMITGAVLPVWRCVNEVHRKENKMRVVRVTTADETQPDGTIVPGQTFVGLHVESEQHLAKILGAVEGLDAAPLALAAMDSEDEFGGAALGGSGGEDDDGFEMY